MRPALGVSASLVASACYAYAPLPHPEPGLGSRVSATLTDAGSLELARLLGPRITTVSGRVVATSEDTLVLAVLKVTSFSEEETFWAGEEVPLPRRLVATLRGRTFAPGRSLFVGSGLVVGSIALYAAFGGFGKGAPSTGGRPPPPPN